MNEHFVRYFVRNADGETEEIYDGEDERGNAFEAVKLYPGGYVESLTYISDGQFTREEEGS